MSLIVTLPWKIVVLLSAHIQGYEQPTQNKKTVDKSEVHEIMGHLTRSIGRARQLEGELLSVLFGTPLLLKPWKEWTIGRCNRQSEGVTVLNGCRRKRLTIDRRWLWFLWLTRLQSLHKLRLKSTGSIV